MFFNTCSSNCLPAGTAFAYRSCFGRSFCFLAGHRVQKKVRFHSKEYGTRDDAKHTLRLERRAADPCFPVGRIIWSSLAEGKRVPPHRSLYCYCANLQRCNPRQKRMFVISALHLKTSRIQNQNDMTSPTLDTASPLNGQVALITGAGRGIGAAIARKLAELGATTVLCGRTHSALDDTARSILDKGGKAEVIACDVTILHQLEYTAARASKALLVVLTSWSTMPESAALKILCTRFFPMTGEKFSTLTCAASTTRSASSPRS